MGQHDTYLYQVNVNFCSVIFQLSRRHTDRQEWD